MGSFFYAFNTLHNYWQKKGAPYVVAWLMHGISKGRESPVHILSKASDIGDFAQEQFGNERAGVFISD